MTSKKLQSKSLGKKNKHIIPPPQIWSYVAINLTSYVILRLTVTLIYREVQHKESQKISRVVWKLKLPFNI